MIKRLLFFLPVSIVCIVINSCKKDTQNLIPSLLTGKWQLASVIVTYKTGSATDSTVTVNIPCTQVFTFNANNTCTYTNFGCITQPAVSGVWSLTPNQLYLQANLVFKDTTTTGTTSPFKYAQIYNLGHFSLVLETGDILPNYSLTAKRKIVQYGFINQNSLGTSQ